MPSENQHVPSTHLSESNELWSSLRKTHDKLNIYSEQLQKLRLDMKELQEKEDAVRQQLAITEMEFETTSADILKEEAPPLMVAFLNKLPREIRDIVYGHLCVSVDPIHVILPGKPENPTNLITVEFDGQLMDVSYLGRTVATELSETYWSMNRFEVTFGLNDGPRAGALGIFLAQGSAPSNESFWRVYAHPWEKIRSLKVNLACEQWEFDSRFGEAKMKDYFTTAHGLNDDLTFAQAAMSELEDQLAPLIRMSGREELHIEIEIHTMLAQESAVGQSRISERHLVNIMESLRKCVCELIHSGVHVTVTLSNIDFFEAHRGPKTWDITSRFVLTPQEWNDEETYIKRQNLRTRYWVQSQAAIHHYVPRSALDDLEGFREMLLRRWKVRYALPWIEGEQEIWHEQNSHLEQGFWSSAVVYSIL